MKLRSKETYWLLKNGLLQTYPSLQKDITCDVLIVGSGITGSLMAYQLSQEGYKTVLIDKRDVAMGSTAATTAMLQYEIDKPLYKLIDLVGEQTAVDSYRAGVSAISSVGKIVRKINAQCGFKRKSSLYVASTKKDSEWLHTELACRKKFKFQVSWLTANQLKQNYGIQGYGAIISEDGASVDGYNFAHALINYSVMNYELKVFDHTGVESVEYNALDNIVLTDTQRIIRSRYVVYATGYETQQILKKKIVELNSTYAFVSEPLQSIPNQLRNSILWDTQEPYLYVRTTSDNRILVGGADEKFENAEQRDKLIDKKENYLLESIQKVIPEMKLIPDFAWAGTFGVTKDSLPYIGSHRDYPNSFFVLGFGGNGITFSVMGMEILSDALSGRPNRFLEYYRFNR